MRTQLTFQQLVPADHNIFNTKLQAEVHKSTITGMPSILSQLSSVIL